MAKKIAFISALGGQGTSLSAVYTAVAAANAGHSMALVDTCGFSGTLAYMLGADEDTVMNLDDAASGECPLEEALTDCGGLLKLLPAVSHRQNRCNLFHYLLQISSGRKARLTQLKSPVRKAAMCSLRILSGYITPVRDFADQSVLPLYQYAELPYSREIKTRLRILRDEASFPFCARIPRLKSRVLRDEE